MKPPKTGVWIIGGLGSVSALTIAGAEALRSGVISQVGMVTARPEFSGLGLVDPGEFVFGGWDIRGQSLVKEAENFASVNGVITPRILEVARDGLETATTRMRPGIALNCFELIVISVLYRQRPVMPGKANMPWFRSNGGTSKICSRLLREIISSPTWPARWPLWRLAAASSGSGWTG